VDGDGIQSTKRCVLKYIQDGVLDKNRTMANVQKHNICTDVPSSQTCRYMYFIFFLSNLRCIGELHLGCDALRYDTSSTKIRRNVLNAFSESKS
jgi:hypothetical protein